MAVRSKENLLMNMSENEMCGTLVLLLPKVVEELASEVERSRRRRRRRKRRRKREGRESCMIGFEENWFRYRNEHFLAKLSHFCLFISPFHR